MSPKQPDDEGGDQPHYERPPLIIDPLQLSKKSNAQKFSYEAKHKRRPAHKRFKGWCRKHATPMNFLTFVIAAAAWAQFMVTQGQLAVTQRQLDEMRLSGQSETDQMWKAINNINWIAKTMDGTLKQSQTAMTASNKQSRDSLSASIESLHTDQRAWVGVIEATAPAEIKARTDLKITVYLINTGRTPALNVLQEGGFAILPKASTIDPAKELVGKQAFSQGVILPNGRRELTLTGLSIEQVEAIRLITGEDRLYLYGRTSYRDIFNQNHKTLFCLRLELATPMSFSSYGPYNSAN